MNKATEIDLADAMDAIENLGKRFPAMSLQDQIDIAARLKGVAKTCKTIDDAVKDEIKAKRKGKEGYVIGVLFKAWMALIPTTRINQEKLELEYPKAYAACLETKPVTRISFEVR